MYSGRKHLDALANALGQKLCERNSPAQLTTPFWRLTTPRSLTLPRQSCTKSVWGVSSTSATRPDIQFSTCILSSNVSCPTTLSMKWLERVVGYLVRAPQIGILIKPIRDGAALSYAGHGDLSDNSHIIVESITDADWAGCKRTRRSRSSIHLSVGGSLVASVVRSQRSIALSSGESEFTALVSGAGGDLSQRVPGVPDEGQDHSGGQVEDGQRSLPWNHSALGVWTHTSFGMWLAMGPRCSEESLALASQQAGSTQGAPPRHLCSLPSAGGEVCANGG